jgi:hypothetical protein
MKHTWNLETLTAAALKYKTKQDFRNAEPVSMSAAYRLKVINKIGAHWEKPLRLIEVPRSDIETAAQKCKTRSEFQYQHSRMHDAAKKQGILKEIYALYIPELRKDSWSARSACQAAKLYKTRKEFQYGSHRGAYQWLRRAGQLDVACKHMPTIRRFQTDEQLIEIARRYKTVTDLLNADPGVRSAICKRGIDVLAYAHMVAADTDTTSDYDAVYLWESNFIYKGLKVYKIGITSHRLGDARIQKVAKAAGMKAKVLRLTKTKSNALIVERELKRIGQRPSLEWFNGYKEFRAMTPVELRQALQIIKRAEHSI